MPTPYRTLNLGIVAHVDAGKTTLTERLLFETGVTRHVGRVDHGDTVTDSDALERRRGITIRSAVVSFRIDADPLRSPSSTATAREPVKVNLIDTPGHSDFVAEVERALAVLDGAVLVVSAVEGVQAQTRVLIRIMERLGIPFLVFANKIDRVGAAYHETMDGLREVLAGDAVALTEPVGLGSKDAHVVARSGPEFVDDLVERLAEHDEALVRQYVDGVRDVTERQVLTALAEQTARGRVHPVLFGAALGGVGVSDVIDALSRYLPTSAGDVGKPLHASVFKIERDRSGHEVVHVRVHEGTLTARDEVVVHHREAVGSVRARAARVSNVRTFEKGATTVSTPAVAGDIATVDGLGEVTIGDQLGRWEPDRSGRWFPPPGLESVVEPRDPAERAALFEALQQLSNQDPLIDARLDGLDHEITVSVYGEVQKEVIAARLEGEYGVAADFLPTRTVHVERPAGVGEGFAKSSGGNASVGLRIEPAPVGSGVGYRLGETVERGYLLPSFHVAIEETVPVELLEGNHGWRVVDCLVTLVHGRFSAPTPSAGEYRRLISQALPDAIRQAGTVVCAPVSRFEAEVPAETMTSVLARLVTLGATPQPAEVGPVRCRIVGTMPTDQVDAFGRRLPGMTGGRGVFLTEPAGYEPVPGPPPTRVPRRHRPSACT